MRPRTALLLLAAVLPLAAVSCRRDPPAPPARVAPPAPVVFETVQTTTQPDRDGEVTKDGIVVRYLSGEFGLYPIRLRTPYGFMVVNANRDAPDYYARPKPLFVLATEKPARVSTFSTVPSFARALAALPRGAAVQRYNCCISGAAPGLSLSSWREVRAAFRAAGLTCPPQALVTCTCGPSGQDDKPGPTAVGAPAGRAQGRDALLLAAAQDADLARVKDLLRRGARPGATDEDGATPLLSCLQVVTFDNAPRTLAIVDALLARGADPNRPNRAGDRPLGQAAASGQPESVDIVARLLRAGARVDAAGAQRETALMNAAEAGDVETVRLLLRAGADPHRRNENGDTALTLARREGLNASDSAAVLRALRAGGR